MFAIDLFKTIGALLVVIIHITSNATVADLPSFSHYGVLLVNRFALVAVPMFIFVSGWGLYMSQRKRPLGYVSFLKKRLVKIIPAYLFFCLVYETAFVKAGLIGFDALQFVKQVMEGTLVYHLYFVPIIVTFYLFFPFFFKVVEMYSVWLVLPIVTIFAICIRMLLMVPVSIGCWIIFLPVFILGMYVAKQWQEFLRKIDQWRWFLWIGSLVLGLALAVGSNSFFNLNIYNLKYLAYTVVALLAILDICLFFDRKKTFPGRKVFQKISEASYYIYLAHPLVIFLTSYFWPSMAQQAVLKMVLLNGLAILLIIVPLSISYIYIKHFLLRRIKKRL